MGQSSSLSSHGSADGSSRVSRRARLRRRLHLHRRDKSPSSDGHPVLPADFAGIARVQILRVCLLSLFFSFGFILLVFMVLVSWLGFRRRWGSRTGGWPASPLGSRLFAPSSLIGGELAAFLPYKLLPFPQVPP